MTTRPTSPGTIPSYLLIGAVYARSQYPRLCRQQRDKYTRPWMTLDDETTNRYASEDARMCAAWRIPLWPYAILFDLLHSPVSHWFTAPRESRRADEGQP